MLVSEHIRGLPLFWALCMLAALTFAYSAWRRFRVLRAVRRVPRNDYPLTRLAGVVSRVFGQTKIFYDPVPGLAHALIFWGFCVISIESLHFFLSALMVDFRLPFTRGPFHALYEVFLVLVLLAVTYALGRRLLFQSRVKNSVDALFVLAMIAGLVLSGLGISAQESALAGERHPWKVVTTLFNFEGDAAFYNTAWWLHGLIFLAFLNYLPYSKHMHVLTVVFNVYFRNLSPKGRMPKLDLENSERFGLADMHDLTFKDVLDGYTCTECGRCTAVCPAARAGKQLDPKRIILDIRDYVRDHRRTAADSGGAEPRPLHEAYIRKADIFDCTTCHACVSNCPVENEHLAKILGIRQNLVLMEGDMPEQYERTFRNLESNANPWGLPSTSRGELAHALGLPTLADNPAAPYVYFLGCAGCYDSRSKSVVKSFARILEHAGVDFAVLGDAEFCCGDPARRMGNEYLFQEMVAMNREVIERHNLADKTILTADPHCFNTLRNEYPDFAPELQVEHHSTFLYRLLAEGRIRPVAKPGRTLVFHDSCYLGRYNDTLDEPRRMLAAMGHQVAEMKNNRLQSQCCGAGGGRAFMEEDKEHRVNVGRAREAITASGDGVAVACPYCALMFEDGFKQIDRGDRKVYDLAELLAERLPTEEPPHRGRDRLSAAGS